MMTKKEKILELKQNLDILYPSTKVFLNSDNEFEFLVAVILSSQAQDKVVNQVTPILFNKYKTIEDYLNADYYEMLNIIKRVGLGPSKTKNIINLSKELILNYKGEVPHDLSKLKTLPGVGQKTASVFLGEIDNKEYIPVDTHILRICKRLNIVTEKTDANKAQLILEKNYPYKDCINFHRQMILFGRNICLASNLRKCEQCKMSCCKSRILKNKSIN